MNKTVLFGLVAFGGLLLVASLTLGGNNNNANGEPQNQQEHAVVITDTFAAFPVYAGTLESFREGDTEVSTTASISVHTTDAKSDVYEWYRRELSSNGWFIKSDKNVAGYQIVQAENGNLYTTFQTAGGGDIPLVISQQMIIRK